MPLESLDQLEIVEAQPSIRIDPSQIEGDIEYPGAVRTAVSNVARGATQTFTAPISYVGALSGIEFLGDTAANVDEFVNDLTPVNPEMADSWLATYIPQGIGQVGAMMIPGAAFFKTAQTLKAGAAAASAAGKAAEAATLLSKAQKVETAGKVALYGLMGGAEGNDAYERSVAQGDSHADAVAKSLGYASVAAAIENKWGTGLLIRRMEGLMGKEAAAMALAEKGLTQRVAQDVLMGAGEEGAQRLAQDLIVTGSPDIQGIMTEGGVGGIIQGLVGLPMNVAMRSMTPNQRAAIAKAEQLVKTGSPATAQVVLEETLSEPLTEEDIAILEPGEKTEVATEKPTAQPAPILPTPEVISELNKSGAPLTAAAIQQVVLTPPPKPARKPVRMGEGASPTTNQRFTVTPTKIKPNETEPTVSDTAASVVQTPVEERVPAPAQTAGVLQTASSSQREVVAPISEVATPLADASQVAPTESAVRPDLAPAGEVAVTAVPVEPQKVAVVAKPEVGGKVKARTITELREAIESGKPLEGTFVSDGNDVFFSSDKWNDPLKALENRRGNWIKVNRGFFGAATESDIRDYREVSEMFNYGDLPGYPGEWMDAADLKPRTPEQIKAAKDKVAEKIAKENEAKSYLDEFSKKSREQWVDAIKKGQSIPVDSAKTYKLEPELNSSGYVKEEYFYSKKNPSAPTETGAAVTPQPPAVAPVDLEEDILFHGTNRPFQKFESGAVGNAGFSRGKPVGRFYFSKDPDAAARVGEAGGYKQVSLEKFSEENDVSTEEGMVLLRNELQAAIDKGMRVAYMQDNGSYVWADNAAELASFEMLDSARVYNPAKRLPRLLKTRVKGKTVDLRGAYSSWPESLRSAVPKPGELDFYWHDRSPALLDWMRANGYSKALVRDSYESGGESVVALPEAIVSFEEVESRIFPQNKPKPTQFTKDSRVRSDRYGAGRVIRQIGKRFQVQFDDGTKFAVAREELTAESEPVVTSAPVAAPAPLNWKDAPARTPEMTAAADTELAQAQRETKKLQKKLAKLEAKEDLTDKERENLLDVQVQLQEQRAVMQTYEDYQQRPASDLGKNPLEAAKEEVKEAFNGLYNLGIQPDPAAQLRFYRAIFNLAVEAVKSGVKTAAEFIAQNPFYKSVSKTMENAFERAQNTQPLPATLDELPADVVHEMEIAGITVEPKVVPQETKQKFSQSAVNLLGTDWAARNPELAQAIRERRYSTTTNAQRETVASELVNFFGDDIEGALVFAKNPPEMSGISDDIQQMMLALIVRKAESVNKVGLAKDALNFYNQLGTQIGANLQARQAAEKIFLRDGNPSTWVLRAETDFNNDQKAVIEPVIRASSVKADVQEAKTTAAKSVALDIEKLAARFFPRAMREMGATMRSIMEQHADSQEATRKALFDLISSHEAFKGISVADRIKLANELQTLWEKARNKELQRIFQNKAQSGGKLAQVVKTNSLPRLIKLINSGALSDESIYNALAPEFDLPYFDEATAAEVFRRAQEMQRMPEGLPKNQRYIDLMNYLAEKRRLSKWETFKSYWYASILSGTGTQATNGIAAAVNVQLQNMLLAAQNPRTASKILLGAMRGYVVSFDEAKAIMGRGDFSNRITNEVMQESSALELASRQGGPVAKFFANMKYVSRLMAFVDTMNAMSAMEARAFHLAARQTIDKYKDTDVSQADIEREIFQMLNLTPEQKAHYQQVAEAEAAQGIIVEADIERRTQDLIRRNRPAEIMEEALNYGKVATFNNKPVGFAGGLAEALNTGRRKFPLLTVVFPFVQTPANVLNELLNYTPVGLWRVAKQNPAFRLSISRATGGKIDPQAQDLSPADYQVLRGKSVFGAMSFIGVALLAAEYDDDKDPPFDISGGWYGIPYPKQQQLMAQGKRKWSIKIGNTWIDYKQTPVAIMLGAVGNYRDTAKYGSENQKGANVSSLTYHLMNGAFIVQDMSFLSSLNEILKAFSPSNTAPVETRLNSLMTRTAGGLVPNLAKEIDTWFDPTIQQPEGFLEHLQAHIPVARGKLNRPMINVLGQEVRDAKTAGDRFYNQQITDDPVWKELARLADMGVFVPVPAATAKVRQNGQRVRMTDEQVYEYRKKSGELYRQKLERDLPRIQRMDAEQATAYFDREFPVLRERTRATLK